MTREEAKELLPIIKAFAEGKTIEFKFGNQEWIETNYPVWEKDSEYRIKSEPKYRPFKNKEECCNEIFEHQPFGWVKAPNGVFLYIDRIFDDGISITDKRSSCRFERYLECDYTFLDGTPVGIKEE